MNVSKVSRPSSILGGKSTYPSEMSVHTNMYRSGYMRKQTTARTTDGLTFKTRRDTDNKIMTD